MKRFLVLFLLLSLPVSKVFCQSGEVNASSARSFSKGYIIAYKGDTLKGFIGNLYLDSLRTVCIFKPHRLSKVTLYGPFDLIGYDLNSGAEKYISVSIPSKEGEKLEFIRVLFEGSYSLLYYETADQKHFLVRRPDNVLLDLTYPPL